MGNCHPKGKLRLDYFSRNSDRKCSSKENGPAGKIGGKAIYEASTEDEECLSVKIISL